MSTLDDKEYNKFELDSWEITLSTVEWVWPQSAVLSWSTLADLEWNKFTSTWKIRIITTF